MAKRRLEVDDDAEHDSIESNVVSNLEIQTDRPVRKPTRRGSGVMATVAAKDFYLKIDPELPRFPFLNKQIFCRMCLVNPNHAIQKLTAEVPFKIELLYADTNELVPNPETVLDITTHEGKMELTLNGIMPIIFCFKEMSLQHENKSFRVRFSVVLPQDPILQVGPLACDAVNTEITSPLTCILHRLNLDSVIPIVWYKDEGGRENCILISGHLSNANNEVVKNRELPLLLRLCYADTDVMTKDQTILKTTMPNLRVDKHGVFEIRCRIEEVSKNHHKQDFIIHVEPDCSSSPHNAEVASVTTTPINVRSKRNKKPRRDVELIDNLPHRAEISRYRTSIPVPSPRDPTPPSSPHSSAASTLSSLLSLATVIRQPTMSSNNGSNIHLPLTDAGHTASIDSVVEPVLSKDSSPGSPRISSSPSPGISTSARDAWSASAYATLLKLEWQTTGYEASLTDSSKQQPIRKCPTCWVSRDIQQTANQPHLANCEIHKLLSSYDYRSLLLPNSTDSLDDSLPPPMMNISRQNSADAIASGAVGSGYCLGLSRQNSGSMDGLLNTAASYCRPTNVTLPFQSYFPLHRQLSNNILNSGNMLMMNSSTPITAPNLTGNASTISDFSFLTTHRLSSPDRFDSTAARSPINTDPLTNTLHTDRPNNVRATE